MITGLHHTGLTVENLDAALDFYTREQAFSLAHRFTIADTPENRTILQLDDASGEVAFLQGTLGCLELLNFSCSKDAVRTERQVYSAGIRHICLQTPISDRLFNSLTGAGARFHARPSGLGTGNTYVYLRDPEDNLLELEGTPWAPAGVACPWFAHAAFVSPDLTRLAHFYTTLTGIAVHSRGSFGPDKKFDVVAGISEVRFQGAWIRLPNAELEFWQYEQPRTTSKSLTEISTPGWSHLCFESDDVHADFERLRMHGVVTHGAPLNFSNATIFFGRDPDGNIFEVLQPYGNAKATVRSMLQYSDAQSIDAARTVYRASSASTGMPVSGND
jgi:catechol 2,3-dioxygenase-like lactoylglutathione lyase family enzyme